MHVLHVSCYVSHVLLQCINDRHVFWIVFVVVGVHGRDF